MAVEEIAKISGSIQVANGYDSDGNTKTASIAFPSMTASDYDAGKANAYAQSVRPCLANDVLGIYITKKYQLFNE